MGWLENVIIENKEIENERLEVTNKDSLYFLGPHLTLRRCNVVLKVSARRLHVLGARFFDCTFEVKQELKNHQAWLRASLCMALRTPTRKSNPQARVRARSRRNSHTCFSVTIR
ncbi:uncharacterized protein STAUR_0038 [Stigmatella aurantiaca DW4/3-1]|uniref:Uncharacterized protein n=1 Tax=Stigmatella aurantiaca (strain DW4/3-1) TaxID=378806 RepID=E3FIU7_STIAD|nr:uncharacterized protein STAUR_0038 [Stigmatella aurantiaca DW4/3-1]